MTRNRIAAALTAAVVGLAAIGASATPAAADGLRFGITIGAPVGYGHYPPARWDHHRWDRNDRRDGWRHHARVQVCEPRWTVRKYEDRRGRVYKVVRVRQDVCRWVRR